jgi:hypothetical protein
MDCFSFKTLGLEAGLEMTLGHGWSSLCLRIFLVFRKIPLYYLCRKFPGFFCNE